MQAYADFVRRQSDLTKLCPITVCVPVYNGERYLEETLNSLRNQTFENFLVLVVDNCSQDSTGDICNAFDDRRFFYIKNAENVGSIRNHNVCLDLINTPYGKLLSADDVLKPDALQTQYDAIRVSESVALVTCNMTVTDSKLKPVDEYKFLPGEMSGSAAIRQCVNRIGNFIGNPSAVLLNMKAVGLSRFSTDLYWLADLEFHCQVLSKGNYVNVNRSLFYYRRHASTDSNLGCPPHIRMRDDKIFVRRFAKSPVPYLRIFARFLRDKWRRVQ